MPSPAESVEVQVALTVTDDWPPVPVESLWATPIDAGQGHYRLDNVPIFATGLGLHDVVRCRRGEGPLTLEDVVRRSGHSTLRVIVAELDDLDDVVATLGALGAGVQRTPIDALLTLDVAPAVDAAPLLAWLVEAEDDGVVDWEEGWLAEAHRPVMH